MENVSTSKSAPGDIESLTRRLAALDEKAFAEFHARYFDSLYQFLLVLNRGREDEAQDVVADPVAGALLRFVAGSVVFAAIERAAVLVRIEFEMAHAAAPVR